MEVGTIGFASVVAIGAGRLLWMWWRAPHFGKQLTPITDGLAQPIQFRPGPPPLPEHDASRALDPQPAR
jgi:hypothetical protein